MQPKSRITVVSEGRLFHGIRTSRAFTWVESPTSDTTPPRLRASRAPTSDLVYVFGQLESLKLAKQEIALRRAEAAALSAGELQQLAATLRTASKGSAR
jgi:hypothetical protein